MNYGIIRNKEIKGTNGWRTYTSNDTKKQMEQDIRANGYTVIRIFSQAEVDYIKSLTRTERILCDKYTEDEIEFVVECF